MVNNTDGSIVGYKYFNLDGVKGNTARLLLNMKTTGVKGNIKVMIDSPWENSGGKCIGQLSLGGKSAKAAIVTAEKGGSAMRNRASELGIDVFDLDDLNNLLNNRTDRRLRNLVRAAN